MNRSLISYVPSPHAGYLKLFRRYPGSTLYVLGEELIKEFKPLVKNLPAITPSEAASMVRSLDIFARVRILTQATCLEPPSLGEIVMPDEDISHALAKEYFKDKEVTFDGSWRLRWDWGTSQKNERPANERLVSVEEFDREIMRKGSKMAAKSSDWWRQVAALLVKDGKILVAAYNKHMPSEHSAYLFGDPRSNFDQGVSIEVSIASHAERRVQAIAARDGVSTSGCDLYVTTFPCPPCAYAWAESGIRRLYYRDGYSALEGANALSAYDIEIIRVEMEDTPVPL